MKNLVLFKTFKMIFLQDADDILIGFDNKLIYNYLISIKYSMLKIYFTILF